MLPLCILGEASRAQLRDRPLDPLCQRLCRSGTSHCPAARLDPHHRTTLLMSASIKPPLATLLRRMGSVLLALTLAPHVACAQAESAAVSTPSLDTTTLDRYFDSLESNKRLMGSVALARNGEVIYRRAFGFRTAPGKGGAASDTETMFRIGSVSKVLTATLIYQLIDEKRLALDTPISRFFPEIANADTITVAHLLGHSSGIPDYTRQIDLTDLKGWNYQPQTKKAMVDRFVAFKPEFIPGERVYYSNSNYVLLGYIVEAVTKSSYASQLEKRVLKRLQLSRTRYGGAVDTKANQAHSYTYEEGGWKQVPEADPSVPAGAGAVVSTPSDLARFISRLFDGELVSENRLAEMTTPFAERLQGAQRKGVVVFTLGRGLDKIAYSHRGGIDGFQSNLVYLPEDRLAIAITLNGQNYSMGKVFWALVDSLYGRPVAVPTFTSVTLTDATLARYPGTYTCKEIGMGMTVRRSEGGLSARAAGQDEFALEPISEQTFSHPSSGILIEFNNVVDGAVPGFSLFQGAGELRFVRDDGAQPR